MICLIFYLRKYNMNPERAETSSPDFLRGDGTKAGGAIPELEALRRDYRVKITNNRSVCRNFVSQRRKGQKCDNRPASKAYISVRSSEGVCQTMRYLCNSSGLNTSALVRLAIYTLGCHLVREFAGQKVDLDSFIKSLELTRPQEMPGWREFLGLPQRE